MKTYKDKYTSPDTGIIIYITGRPIGAHTSAKELYDIFDAELENEDLTDGMLLNAIHNEWSGGYGVVVDTGEAIFAFTDPQGIEQLYYTTNTYPFTIESSLADFEKSSIDNQYISEICKWGYNTDNRTPWENIKRVMPGKLLVYNHGDIGEISIFEKYFTDYHPTKSLKELIEISVLKQLAFVEKQDSIGVLLSGGLDSCCIAYELLNLQKSNKLGDIKLNFYTINNEEDAPFVKIFEETERRKVITAKIDLELKIKNENREKASAYMRECEQRRMEEITKRKEINIKNEKDFVEEKKMVKEGKKNSWERVMDKIAIKDSDYKGSKDVSRMKNVIINKKCYRGIYDR